MEIAVRPFLLIEFLYKDLKGEGEKNRRRGGVGPEPRAFNARVYRDDSI